MSDEREASEDVIKEREVRKETKVQEKNPSNITEQELSPEYIYTTKQSVEDFGDVSFEPITDKKNDLSPPSPFIPTKNTQIQHDEQNVYNELGLFAEEVRYIFDPSKRSESNIVRKPVGTLYEKKQDDTQLDVRKVVRTECRCKDGSIVMGYLDTRSGQKDCSPCKKSVFNSPNIYKNYRTKRSTPNFQGKQVPLRKQVGVSHFGDVNMKGCRTGNETESLERVNQISTLNNITNIDTKDSIGGSNISVPQNDSGLPISLYDSLNTNVYKI